MSKPRYWTRTIDSAQRTITIEKPNPNQPSFEKITFNIQGVQTEFAGGKQDFHAYMDMAEQGVRTHNEKPLNLFERLIRRESKVGEAHILDDNHVSLTLWTRPPLEMVFNVAGDEGKAHWREAEIMMRSAGYNFRLPPNLPEGE